MDRLEATGPDPPEVDLAILLGGGELSRNFDDGRERRDSESDLNGIGVKGPALVLSRLSLRGICSVVDCSSATRCRWWERRDLESDLYRDWCEGTRSSSSAVVVVGDLSAPPRVLMTSANDGTRNPISSGVGVKGPTSSAAVVVVGVSCKGPLCSVVGCSLAPR